MGETERQEMKCLKTARGFKRCHWLEKGSSNGTSYLHLRVTLKWKVAIIMTSNSFTVNAIADVESLPLCSVSLYSTERSTALHLPTVAVKSLLVNGFLQFGQLHVSIPWEFRAADRWKYDDGKSGRAVR